LAKNKMVVVSHPPTCPVSLLVTIFYLKMKQDLKLRCFADAAEVQPESLAALDGISLEDFRQCLQHREQHWDCCFQSQGVFVRIF
jgi:hypothetical protein